MSKYSYILVFLCSLMLIGCRESTAADNELGLSVDDNSKIIIENHQAAACERDEDCVLVPGDCNHCCTRHVINVEFKELYERTKSNVCEAHSPRSVCNCFMMEIKPVCINNKCETKLVEEN